MNYLVTGASGFIGNQVAYVLCQQGHNVIGIDNNNNYYDVNLKLSRLNRIKNSQFKFIEMDFSDKKSLDSLFEEHDFERVIHLGAQAGIRYSVSNPHAYANSNLIGHLNILESCRHNKIQHLIYASSSSVYGLNTKIPFTTSDSVDHPVSLYAATKKSNELMSHSYSHLYNIPTTGLRFFTVYGPWGRPDMAPFIFTQKILNGEIIDINNFGEMWRDFTYIDDIVEAIIRLVDIIPVKNPEWTTETGSPASSSAPYAIYNVGHGSPINLMEFISELENALGIEAKKNFREMQLGDVYKTYADTQDLYKVTGYTPKTNLKEGVKKFIDWYKEFYKK
ncbi:SDR family NAD(P)-dependent oxidoreductase [Providencia rettgeri]|uniref:SDR family NAD(P)-dependent oxidoreductase n=1 Tax=Providencia rettgeri TaxID=587 RepID=UPI00235F7C59|nr:SDR family NAD(P)-dependent oxidoreductase [Providencia rettgeri]